MFKFLLIAAALTVWLIAYFAYIRPRLEEFKLTAGIYDKIDAMESGLWSKVSLKLSGYKTAIGAFVMSMIPIIGPFVDSLNGMNWSAVFPTERAATVGFMFAFLAAAIPLVMAMTHAGGLSAAARTVPVAVASDAPVLPAVVATTPASVNIAPAVAAPSAAPDTAEVKVA